MRFNSLIEEVSTTPSYFLVFTAVLTLILHIIFVWYAKLSDYSWKRVDYIWISAGLIGILGTCASANRFLSQRYLEGSVESQTSFAYSFLRDFMESSIQPDGALNGKHVKTEQSPPDFDQIEKDRQQLRDQISTLLNVMPKIPSNPLPSLDEIHFVLPTGDTNSPFGWYITAIKEMSERYSSHHARYLELRDSIKTSDWQTFSTVLGPLIMGFAFALRLTKVSGELANAKRKRCGN